MILTSLIGCAARDSNEVGPVSGTLHFTDENVAMIEGGYTGSSVAVEAGADLCFDASGLSSSVASIEVWHTGIGDAALRCSLARGQLSQAVAIGAMWIQNPIEGRSCLSAMQTTGGEPLLTCDEGEGWVVMARDASSALLAFRILDPCVHDGATTVTLDDTAPSFTDINIDIEDAAAFTAREGTRYTLDWSTLTRDGFDAPVVPPLYGIMIARIPESVSLEEAALDPELSADESYEVWSESMDATSADLMSDDSAFPGFSQGENWLIGFSPPSDCVPASILGRVDVVR